MPFADVGGVKLFYEETGQGAPLIFVHEFAGDYQSWHLQVRFFARRYRTIAYNARGYPPSDVPDKPEAYSQERAADDILGVLDALKIHKAHICGLSMGGYAVLHFGLRHPGRALSLTVAGAGYGSVPGERERFRKDVDETARRFDDRGHGGGGRPSTPRAPPACSSWTRTRRAGRSSTISSSRSPRRATRSPCGACRCRGRRSSSSRPRWSGWRCRP